MADAPQLELEKERLYKDALAEAKKELNPTMANNPVFDEMLHKEFNYFLYKTGSVDFKFSIENDKNSLSIVSFSPVVDCNPLFRNKNKAFLKTVFYLDSNDNFICEFNQGVLYDRKDIEDSGVKVALNYKTRLETYYSNKGFDKDGIQLSDNSYVDCYPFENKSTDIDLRERVMSSFHKPAFNLKGFPSIPIHVIKATVRNTYRKYDSLGVIHSNMGIATRDGYKDLVCGLYTCSTDRPELLRGYDKFAEAKGTANSELTFLPVEGYAPTLSDAFTKAEEDFKKGIEESHLEEFNKKTYEAIVSRY